MKKPTPHDAGKGKRKRKPSSASSKKKQPLKLVTGSAPVASIPAPPVAQATSLDQFNAKRAAIAASTSAAGLPPPSAPALKGPDARTSDEEKKTGQRDEKGQFGPGNEHAWQKGESGNPAGRPKCITLSEAYRKQLAMIDPRDEAERTFAEVIAEKMVRVACGFALESASAAAREICDRTEGKAKQPIELDVKGEARTMLAAFLGVSVDQLPATAKD
jgi:hypothetical protein